MISNSLSLITAIILSFTVCQMNCLAKQDSNEVIVATSVSTLADDIDAGAGGLSISSSGDLYTADFGWRIDGQGKGGDKICRVDGKGKVKLFCRGMRGASGNTFDSNGNLFQSSIGGNFVTKVTPDAKLEVVAKTGLANPVGVAVLEDGTMFVCNCGANRIQKITPDGTSKAFCQSPLFKCPNGIAVGKDGTLFVCNFGNGDVIKVTKDGKASRLATLPGNNNGHLTLHDGELFVVARSDNRVYRVNMEGEAFVFAGSGRRGDKNGDALASEFSLPNSIVVSPDGRAIYINETSPASGDPKILGPTRIRKIKFTKVPSTSALAPQPIVQVNPALRSSMSQAQALIGQQKLPEAEKVLKSAMEIHGEQPQVAFLLGYILHAQKKYDEALRMYDRSRKFPQTKMLSFYNIACIHSIRKETDKAIENINRAVTLGYSNFSQMKSDADFNNIKDDPRFKAIVSGKSSSPGSSSNGNSSSSNNQSSGSQANWLSDDELFVEKSRIINKWSGEAAGDQFGWTARRVGDLDGDKVIDFITTAPTHKNGSGKIYIYSSATGKLLYWVTGQSGDRLGNSAVGLGDVNGDGITDFIAGAPASKQKGAAFVYSGKDASLIHELRGTTAGGQFGYEVSELGDYDGDGVGDFLVGETAGNGQRKKSGRAIVYSGKTAKQIFELKGEKPGDSFGNAAASAKLAPGEFLLAIGAQNAGPKNRGRVYVYHVKDAKPKLRFQIKGDEKSVNLGQMFISFPSDVNKDGVPDVYASDFSDSTKARGGGKVVVHSGADGKELIAIYGEQLGEGLGTSPSDAGDVDGDGVGDLVIGAWQNREGARSGGKVYLYSLAGEGTLLRSWTAKQAGDTLGFDACGIGDVDGDGIIDFLLTSAWSNKRGPKTGRVFIVAGEKYSN